MSYPQGRTPPSAVDGKVPDLAEQAEPATMMQSFLTILILCDAFCA